MQFSSRLTIAVHILLCIETLDDVKVTSNVLAGSINTNPVIVRNILGLLSSAGIVEVKAGVGGASLAKPSDDITLLDIFKAVEKEEALFHFHENPNLQCPIGRSVHSVMDGKLENIRSAMEAEMSKTTLRQLVNETKKQIEE
ncbi:MAG: Rrf2 family transcriptional regulator [Ruminococcaceae bacterium]|nr:Rrf2 family transcriptional regulator [Oscillospiraceae bacterium]